MSAPPIRGVEALTADLRRRAFGVGSRSGVRKVGLEVELLPTDGDSGRPLPLDGGSGRTSLELLRGVALEEGWREERTPEGIARFELPGGGSFTFEPGGQIEFSSAPRTSVDRLLEDTVSAVGSLTERARSVGVVLGTRGIDPRNDAETARLRVPSRRYRRLAGHLERIGPAGRRMMLQTAAVHVNLDLGSEPLRRWAAANALVPSLIALFANSSRYAGAATGFRSFRARQWRELDPSRTGVFAGDDPISAYLRFALEADAVLLGADDEKVRPFREWLARDGVGRQEWREHLDTLFPEVRPRGYLEIRCVDALPPRWYAAPLVVLAGILCDREACRTALELLGPPGEEELRAAARRGLDDAERADRCRRLFDLALEGAGRLGPDFIGGRSLERARAFRARYTAHGEDPAGDPEAARA